MSSIAFTVIKHAILHNACIHQT